MIVLYCVLPPGSLIVDSAIYGSGDGLIFDIECTSDDSTASCTYVPSNCSRSSESGIVCKGKIPHVMHFTVALIIVSSDSVL